MVKKSFNTPKGRKLLPSRPAVYNLKDRLGKTIYTGMTGNLKRRISVHHGTLNKHFQSLTYKLTRTRAQAGEIESNRLHLRKPLLNKKK